MIKIGIIGCGKIAQTRHLPEYATNPDAKLVGYYDKISSRAVQMAEKYGGKVYDSYYDLINDPEIDAVSVCVENRNHAEITNAALYAGKHVLVEKPMAVTLAECESMVAAAEFNGKHLMVGHNMRFDPVHRRAKELLEAGVIGDIITFRTTIGNAGPEGWSPDRDAWFFDKDKAAMGALSDLGIHKLDLLQYLTGQTVIETTAKVMTLNKHDDHGHFIGVDDNAICVYELSGGAMGTMTASWTYYGAEDNSTILYGTKGIMRIYDDPAAAIKVILTDGSKISYDVEAIQTNDNQTKSGVIDLWMDSLVNNREPEISGRSALTAMRAVFASLRSSELGTAVEIPENR